MAFLLPYSSAICKYICVYSFFLFKINYFYDSDHSQRNEIIFYSLGLELRSQHEVKRE